MTVTTQLGDTTKNVQKDFAQLCSLSIGQQLYHIIPYFQSCLLLGTGRDLEMRHDAAS